MSNLAIFQLAQYARELIKDPAVVKKAISIAVGIAFSRALPLPSSEVGYAENHYNDTIAVSMSHKAVDFNEECLIDIDLACQTARSFWLIRYYNAHPAKVLPIPSEEGGHFMSSLTGVGHLINPATFDFCQEYDRRMIALVNRVREATEQ